MATIIAIATFVVRLSRPSFQGGNQKTVNWSRNEPSANLSSAGPSERTSKERPSTDRPVSPLPFSSASISIPSTTDQSSPIFTGPAHLIVPVAGVRPDQLRDTFSDARAAGRIHDAIDIPAALGTPVVAAADGIIVKLFHSDPGGTTIYQSSTDSRFIFYYAHLDRYAEGLADGRFVRQGETIAYVGDTGNAGAGNYHLHFSIAAVSDPKEYWQGININPYPLLHK
ncbi:MAG: M23 family metallopeptidase [Pyrinomonadaceae bacterium]